MFDHKTLGVSWGFPSEGGGWCEECTEGVLGPSVERFVRGLGFCLTKKPRGFPGGCCLKVGVSVEECTEGVSGPGPKVFEGVRFLFDQKNPGVSRGFLSEGRGWCEECTEGVSGPGVKRFVRGLAFCLTKKLWGVPGGFCLKAGVGVRSALKEFQVRGLKGLSGG